MSASSSNSSSSVDNVDSRHAGGCGCDMCDAATAISELNGRSGRDIQLKRVQVLSEMLSSLSFAPKRGSIAYIDTTNNSSKVASNSGPTHDPQSKRDPESNISTWFVGEPRTETNTYSMQPPGLDHGDAKDDEQEQRQPMTSVGDSREHVLHVMLSLATQLVDRRPTVVIKVCRMLKVLLSKLDILSEEELRYVLGETLGYLLLLLSHKSSALCDTVIRVCETIIKVGSDAHPAGDEAVVKCLIESQKTCSSERMRKGCLKLLSRHLEQKKVRDDRSWNYIAKHLPDALQCASAGVRDTARLVLLRAFACRPAIFQPVVAGLDHNARRALLKLVNQHGIESHRLLVLMESTLKRSTASPGKRSFMMSQRKGSGLSNPDVSKSTSISTGSVVAKQPAAQGTESQSGSNWMLENFLDLSCRRLTPSMLSYIKLPATCDELMRFVTCCDNPQPLVHEFDSHLSLKRSHRVVRLLTSSDSSSREVMTKHAVRITMNLFRHGFARSSANIFHVCTILRHVMIYHETAFCAAVRNLTPEESFGAMLSRIDEPPVGTSLFDMISKPPLVDISDSFNIISRVAQVLMTHPHRSAAESACDIILSALSRWPMIPNMPQLLLDENTDNITVAILPVFGKDELSVWRARLIVGVLRAIAKLVFSHARAQSEIVEARSAEAKSVLAEGQTLASDRAENNERREAVGGDATVTDPFAMNKDVWKKVVASMFDAIRTALPQFCSELLKLDCAAASTLVRPGAKQCCIDRLEVLQLIASVVELTIAQSEFLSQLPTEIWELLRRWSFTYRHNSLILLQIRRVWTSVLLCSNRELAESVFLTIDNTEEGMFGSYLQCLIRVYLSNEPRSTFHSVVLDLFSLMVRLSDHDALGERLSDAIKETDYGNAMLASIQDGKSEDVPPAASSAEVVPISPSREVWELPIGQPTPDTSETVSEQPLTSGCFDHLYTS